MTAYLLHKTSAGTLLALMLAGAPAPVLAQSDADQQSGTSGDCQAQGENKAGKDEGTSSAQNDDMQQKLEKCGSVLEPPATGDSGVVKPAPDSGSSMPVIKPKNMPETQPSDPDAG